MASKQRARAPKKERKPNPLADLGIFNIPDLDVMDDDIESDVDESALESELEAILSGKSVKPSRPKKRAVAPLDIETMAAECLKDIEDEDEDDESLLKDPELLKELRSLSFESPEGEDLPLSVEEDMQIEMPGIKEVSVPSSVPQKTLAGGIVAMLEERLKLYNDAIAAAKELNESSKIRRYGRAVKTLEQLIKTAKAGKVINEEDIPPPVSIPKTKARPPPPKPEVQSEERAPLPMPRASDIPTGNLIDTSSDIPTGNLIDTSGDVAQKVEVHPAVSNLMTRRDEYKMAALKAKKAGDKTTALSYMKTLKNIDAAIEGIKNGEVDLSNVPTFPHPEASTMPGSIHPRKEFDETQASSSSAIEAAALSAASEPEDPALFGAPPPPSSVLEALSQRLEKFRSSKNSAQAEGNNSKVRRLERIIKSYEKAIKDFQAGKPVDFEELPAPPGFAPIPIPDESTKPKHSPGNVPPKRPAPEVPSKKVAPEVPPKKVAPQVPPKKSAPEVPQKGTPPQKPKVQRTNTSTVEKQLEFLLERQKMFRQAAISSKKNGDIEQAKNYLRLSKGFDSMIEATRCGLPIDYDSIPTPPQLEADFVIVDVQDCVEGCQTGSENELFETLQNDLTKQIEVCTRNKDHFLKLGDVSSASKFEKLLFESKQDLNVIKNLKKNGKAPPLFHYETRLFSIVQCNTHLSDSELEVIVERGINLPGKPDDLDSYVRIHFPIPSDAPQNAKTHTVRDTNNPIYQEEFKFEINRKSRAQLRQFKRAILKFEVWSKGGFLRSDTLIGTANVKLVDLESICNIHDSFDLMDGRKNVGGKLEIKVRIRNPLLAKQVQEVREKWLVIGN